MVVESDTTRFKILKLNMNYIDRIDGTIDAYPAQAGSYMSILSHFIAQEPESKPCCNP